MTKARQSALSVLFALSAVLLLAIGSWASSTYSDSITGGELPNATGTEGQFTGTATGRLPGAWYIDVTHQVLSPGSPAAITGGSFKLDTTINYRLVSVTGAFAPSGGTITQTAGFIGCSNQTYAVDGALDQVGINGGTGSGEFRATLTHYRAWFWWFGCLTYSATVTGSVSLTF